MATPDDVRELALALPQTIERSSYGTPGFRVGDRLFARLHQDGESLVVWVDMDEREMLAQTEPGEVFLDPPLRQAPDGAGAPRRCRARGDRRGAARFVAAAGARGSAEKVRRGLAGAGRDFPLQPISEPVPLDIKVVVRLQVQPEPFGNAKVA